MKHKMISNAPMRYATRRLFAGDEFEASARDAKVFAAVDRLSRGRKGAAYAADRIPQPDPLDVLRVEAEAAGVKVDRRWGEARLREELAAARKPKRKESDDGRYSRRDMRAED
jgi:hypothetical protein